MRVLATTLAVILFAGAALIASNLWENRDRSPGPLDAPPPFDLRTPTGPDTPPPAAPTATLAAASPPAPTPTPYDGPVARISAPAIGLDHPIEEIGLLPNNQLDTPHDALGKVGWYYIYDRPGWRGNAIFAAHLNYNFQLGPFANLRHVEPGHPVTVTMADGTAYTYQVFFYRQYSVDSIPMGDIIDGLLDGTPRPPGEEWITLITCGGDFQPTDPSGLGEYLHRDVVVARRTLD